MSAIRSGQFPQCFCLFVCFYRFPSLLYKLRAPIVGRLMRYNSSTTCSFVHGKSTQQLFTARFSVSWKAMLVYVVFLPLTNFGSCNVINNVCNSNKSCEKMRENHFRWQSNKSGCFVEFRVIMSKSTTRAQKKFLLSPKNSTQYLAYFITFPLS